MTMIAWSWLIVARMRSTRQTWQGWASTSPARPATSGQSGIPAVPYRTKVSYIVFTSAMKHAFACQAQLRREGLTAPPLNSLHLAAYHCITCLSRMFNGTPLKLRCLSCVMNICSSANQVRSPSGPWTIARGSRSLKSVPRGRNTHRRLHGCTVDRQV